MTGVAGSTGIGISIPSLMLAIHIRLIVFVAVDTTEHGIVCAIGMAFGTIVPPAPVLPAVNREILAVMIP